MSDRPQRRTVGLVRSAKLHPDFPVVSGPFHVTPEWSLFLPDKFNHRQGIDHLLFWRPGFILWVAVWNNAHARTARERMRRLKADIPEHAEDVQEEEDPGALRLRFRIHDETSENGVRAYYAFAMSDESAMQITIFFDDETQAAMADGLWRSVSRGRAASA